MNVAITRNGALQLLVVAQTAVRSGEWDVTRSDPTLEIEQLDTMLMLPVPIAQIQRCTDRVAEMMGDALCNGIWTPGDWASEWQSDFVHCLYGIDGMTRVVPMPLGEKIEIFGIGEMRLAA